MEKRIRERFNDAILQEAMRRYGIEREQIHLLDGFESFMYEFERGAGSYILRLGHSFRRTVPLIQGEVDWLNYLARGGASVARAILSERGNLVELIDDGRGENFLATAFVKAKGKAPSQATMTPTVFETYGQLIGMMHALTKEYEPPDPAWRRLAWDDPEMLEVERHLPASEAVARERFRELMKHLNALPKDKETYGLIHQDAHGGNFFLDEAGQITLFDFDDCAYSWFMNDIAIVLFYAVMGEPDERTCTRAFMRHFLRGYARENQLAPFGLKEIPYFLKLREIDLYAAIHRSFDVNNLDDPWAERFMRGRKERIENEVPYVDFDFELLAQYL